MNIRPASLSFLAVCLALAGLLLMHVITPPVSGAIFAVALAVFGIASKGFRQRRSVEGEDE